MTVVTVPTAARSTQIVTCGVLPIELFLLSEAKPRKTTAPRMRAVSAPRTSVAGAELPGARRLLTTCSCRTNKMSPHP